MYQIKRQVRVDLEREQEEQQEYQKQSRESRKTRLNNKWRDKRNLTQDQEPEYEEE